MPQVKRLAPFFFSGLFGGIIALGLALIVLSGLLAHTFYVGSVAKETTTIVVAKGQGLSSVASQLEENELVSSRHIFSLAAVLAGAQRDLRAGEYTIAQGASMTQIFGKLRDGDTVARRVVIPEGLTVNQIIARLDDVKGLTGEVYEVPPEGSLLPETYHFSLGDTRQGIINRMRQSMTDALAALWPERQEGLPVSTPQEALILASIVERETSVDRELSHIAGVFVHRLNRKMKLQSDPTIIYGLTGGEPLGRGLRRSEIRKKTPYNTYHIKGLPPTPICNPGMKTIAAVLNPLKTNDLFFVADGKGGHAFAETYAEHKKNVKAWRNRKR